MNALAKPIVFAGPSLFPLTNYSERWDVEFFPPVARDGINRIVRNIARPGTLVIADGVFHASLSVGHAEIRNAIDLGWKVHGVSSMGAIRAAEMMHLGMIGHGSVFRMFVDDDNFADDEVALLHTPAPPYYPGSEPLVHIRAFLKKLNADGTISADAYLNILANLKSSWFGYRTLELVTQQLCRYISISESQVEEAISNFRIKHFDLVDLLNRWPSNE